MSEILSQAEIDALLRGEDAQSSDQILSPEEIDALGEIGNISMGTAATTLFSLLNRKVTITTPEVSVTTLQELSRDYSIPFVAVEVLYTQGLKGTNLLILAEDDVKIITDLMMGGDGLQTNESLNDMHLSAIGEVMNQMIGSAATSLATIFDNSINISPPRPFVIDFNSDKPYDLLDSNEPIVKINFKMEVGSVINSYIMQLLPLNFAKDIVDSLLKGQEIEPVSESSAVSSNKPGKNTVPTEASAMQAPPRKSELSVQPVDIQPVAFQTFNQNSETNSSKENINLIMDVPLQVTVELGKTRKLIKDILDLNSGSIIELDRMAGEPVDILVNGKLIAKGEVVVIDDNFGVRITDIISRVNRVKSLGDN